MSIIICSTDLLIDFFPPQTLSNHVATARTRTDEPGREAVEYYPYKNWIRSTKGNPPNSLNKKSFFGKATPDYDLARPLFEQAAVQFKASKATLLAVSAHSKAAECYKQQNALFLAGKQFESAALLAMNDKQLNQQSEAARLFKAAGDLFVMYGNSEKGAEVVEKAGRCLEDTDVNRAIEYYNDAISLYDTDGKPRSAIDTYGRFISFLARHKQWGQAVENSDKLVQLFRKLDNHPSYNRQVLTTTLLVLLSGDSVDARKRLNAYEEFQGFYDSDEGEISHQLVESFETYDDELLANVLKRPNIKYLDNEIARASLALRIPGSGKSAAAPQPQYNAPQQQFNIPQNFGAPQQYGAPPQGFNPPHSKTTSNHPNPKMHSNLHHVNTHQPQRPLHLPTKHCPSTLHPRIPTTHPRASTLRLRIPTLNRTSTLSRPWSCGIRISTDNSSTISTRSQWRKWEWKRWFPGPHLHTTIRSRRTRLYTCVPARTTRWACVHSCVPARTTGWTRVHPAVSRTAVWV
ncbi:TPR-like protein [Rhizoclosmatium globosum]|uniref:Gamma-soluble NSF attachment protein n=1 Tax=Rhizoclosmatium globosum TaxID=329046 RepID=A0A1Y2AYL1_9FUNG|nr:TPR-like protein [Rhizoclosmatium globosum]|eukprot:ORY27576.1 TPR-like protein [Rhizoclosmatium globosum]